MLENQMFRAETAIGPLGERLTLASLSASPPARWTARRKAEVVAAVHGKLLSIEEACGRYDLTIEELASWQRAHDRSGLLGLRTTKVQHYRDLYEAQQRY